TGLVGRGRLLVGRAWLLPGLQRALPLDLALGGWGRLRLLGRGLGVGQYPDGLVLGRRLEDGQLGRGQPLEALLAPSSPAAPFEGHHAGLSRRSLATTLLGDLLGARGRLRRGAPAGGGRLGAGGGTGVG